MLTARAAGDHCCLQQLTEEFSICITGTLFQAIDDHLTATGASRVRALGRKCMPLAFSKLRRVLVHAWLAIICNLESKTWLQQGKSEASEHTMCTLCTDLPAT